MTDHLSLINRLRNVALRNDDKIYKHAAPVDESEQPCTSGVGICDDCGIAMYVFGNEYKCTSCGRITQYDRGDNDDTSETTNTSIRIPSKSGGKHINSNSSRESQLQDNIRHLHDLKRAWAAAGGTPFSDQMLNTVANNYTKIQRIVLDHSGGKKIVHRRSVKGEIFAALLYYESLRSGAPRQRSECPQFMTLKGNGFSRGEKEVTSLIRNKLLDIGKFEIRVEDYAERYLRRINMYTDNNHAFIVEIVNRAKLLNIGTKFQLCSKTAGALWILLKHTSCCMEQSLVEFASSGIRKTTFEKFYRLVIAMFPHFRDVFLDHAILI